MKSTGVTSRGIITPIFQQGDDLAVMTVESIIKASKNEGFEIKDKDVIGVTEAVLGRTQGNYATITQISTEIKNKLGGKEMGIVFPILSRNRFLVLLKAIALSCEKLYIQLSYPSDEVGNALVTLDDLDNNNVNPYTDNFSEEEFRAMFPDTIHPFTGIDYIEEYRNIAPHVEIVFSNDPSYILNFTHNVIACDIHTRKRTQRLIRQAGGTNVYRLDELLTESVDGSGYNAEFGLLGSNKATDETVKLFPRDSQIFVEEIQALMKERTGKHVEVLVFGDGCFKDPVGGIWEFADPVSAPGYTSGLEGTPNEIKIKYIADNEFADLKGDQLAEALKKKIKEKAEAVTGATGSQGTTPRRYTDLLGSLCDLTSGSGDRGTPVVLIQGYFTNYASD